MKTVITILCWFIPFKKLRHRLKVKYVKSKRIKYHNNNRIIIHMPNGDTVINPYSIPGLEVSFNGTNSTIELFYPISFHNCHLNVENNCVITIHESHGVNNMTVDTYNKSEVFIDKNVEIGGVHIHMSNEAGTALRIGKDVVLSYDIEIYTTDTHPIFDIKGKCINNKKACIEIGEHCWICASCVLLKGAKIPENCILGHSSVCSNKLSQPNSIYAGNPCKCVKSNIRWYGGKID